MVIILNTNTINIFIAAKMTEDIGIVSLGKYTFPMIPELLVKVKAVEFIHVEK